jgi:hypothetical protein
LVRRSFTAVIERNTTLTGSFETEPYETGWAIEALWFVNVLKMEGDAPKLKLRGQVSPDGLCWCDAPCPPVEIDCEGLYSFSMREFGNWLRIAGGVSGDDAGARVIIYLALKG